MKAEDRLISTIYQRVRCTHKDNRGDCARLYLPIIEGFCDEELWASLTVSPIGSDEYSNELEILDTKFSLLRSWLDKISEIFPETEKEDGDN